MNAGVVFHDRIDGGRWLAAALMTWRDADPVVVALPRGGVPVGYEVARALGAPLDLLVVRKLTAPGRPTLRLGALAEGGARYLDEDLIESLGMSVEQLQELIELEQVELSRRVLAYRGGRAPIDLRGRTVLLTDDGLATGVTARAAIAALRSLAPKAIVVAAPVCAPDTLRALQSEVDAVVCARSPTDLAADGHWYEDFSQTSEEEVRWCLGNALVHGARRALATRS
jgi:predicted phosphoribosyltransferase